MAVPDLNTGIKWKMEEAIRETVSRLHAKEVIEAVADGRLGFGCEKVQWFSNDAAWW